MTDKPRNNPTHKEESDRLAAQCKLLEQPYDVSLPSSAFWVVRLDGRAFHTFTKGFDKPCDWRVLRPMIRTTFDLVTEFQPSIGYCQSDEITLVFPPLPAPPPGKKQGGERLFGGRVLKICSVLSGFASARFVMHCIAEGVATEAAGEAPPPLVVANLCVRPSGFSQAVLAERMKLGSMHFDCRVFHCDTATLAFEALDWRATYDCRRNAGLAVGHAHFSSEAMHKKGPLYAVQRLQQTGIAYDDYPAAFRYGVFIKRETRPHKGYNPITKKETDCIRTSVTMRAFGIAECLPTPEERESLVTAMTWNSIAGVGPAMVLPEPFDGSNAAAAGAVDPTTREDSPVRQDSKRARADPGDAVATK